ncbi:MAG: cell wall metabolism sensor histidine kinase WalK [Atribacterota bacterium]|nr:cell wall metabolism sensor histidine kinase WalK [Atribacterota bacterium]
MKKSLFTKLLFSHLLVITISYFVLGFSLSFLFSRYYFSLQEKDLVKRGENLINILTQTSDLRFEIPDVARRFIQGIFITVVSKEELLRERPLPPRGFMRRMWGRIAEIDLPQKIWEKIQKGEYISWQSFHPALRQDVLSVALPLESEGEAIAALILSIPLTNIETTVKTVEYFLLFSSLISLSLSLLVAFFSSSSLARPLKRMSEVARQLARGNFQEKIKIETQDEVGQLAQDFNTLSEALEETIRKLREEKERTENIFLHMSEGVLAIDGNKRIVSMNPALQRTLSIEEESISTLQDLHLGEEIEKLFEEVLQTGQEKEKEIEFLGRKNIVFHITPLKEKEAVKGAVAVVQDITELRKVDQLRREFIANVSHELRTPLTSIQGFLEAVIDQVVSLEEFKEKYLPLIHGETLRLSRLIHDLLDLSLMESGKIRWEIESVPINHVVRRVIAKLSPLLSARQIEIHEEFENNLPPALGNEDRLDQVFTNLLHNAILFSSPGSSITVGGRVQGQHLLLFVRDQGSGIPPQDLPYIFERFYRVEKSRSREGGGTGLGLAITKQIVEHHEGTIWAESELGRGTTFFFTLPIAPSFPHQSPAQDLL